ncbi:GNAT family N-acetyltransferase [Puniceibacterium sediminis]|uniref:Ribosomal protein S18 acetylase RimI n=1 Tax=Puniceibacterium sediminis TaxID=1608407 RepID=A0A238YVD7_9RHOB|nr:GNAT family N-acetyltransferase [Puniceibacterium sediminis]SNR74543.1 Ribosomal protein S18 acetylase RimI [Puniceibacterium sediminis]
MSNIRPIEARDLNALVPLCQEHAEYEGLTFTRSDQVERWDSLFFAPQPHLFGWVVDMAGPLQGYMTATIDTATWAARPFVYLDCLYLAPSIRRQGFGRRMMATLQRFACEHDCKEIQWQTPPDNDLGRAFYHSLRAQELTKSRFTLQVAHDPEFV